MERKLPIPSYSLYLNHGLIRVLHACIRWKGRVSHCLSLTAGVRQGGVLSPFMFAIFIDTIVERVKN